MAVPTGSALQTYMSTVLPHLDRSDPQTWRETIKQVLPELKLGMRVRLHTALLAEFDHSGVKTNRGEPSAGTSSAVCRQSEPASVVAAPDGMMRSTDHQWPAVPALTPYSAAPASATPAPAPATAAPVPATTTPGSATAAPAPAAVPAMADAPSATAGAQSSNEEPTSAAAARLASAATALSTLKLALPAVVPQLPASPSPRWFEVVHFPTVIVRKEPSMLAKPLGTALFGDLIAVEAVEVHQNQAWARLTAAERHSLVINYQIHEVAVEAAWMLIDGTSLGLSTLLREALPALHPPLPQWQLPHRLYLAAFHARDERLYRTSLPVRVRYARLSATAAQAEEAERVRRTQQLSHERYMSLLLNSDGSDGHGGGHGGGNGGGDGGDDGGGNGGDPTGASAVQRQFLSWWVPEESSPMRADRRLGLLGTADGMPYPPPSAIGPNKTSTEARSEVQGEAAAAAAAALPRLAIALLLRGAPPACVSAFLTYHLAVGFERIYLFFDAPDDPGVAAARQHEDTTRRDSGVVVTLCDEAYWREQRRTNFFFKPHPRWQRWQGGSKDLSTANFEKGDVQCRQCVVVQDATERARAGGVDWLLHIDIDELWYSPHPACQRDARQSFRAVPPSVSELIFHNHEAVPRYASREGECWFTRNTLFKVCRDPSVRWGEVAGGLGAWSRAGWGAWAALLSVPAAAVSLPRLRSAPSPKLIGHTMGTDLHLDLHHPCSR